MKSEKVNKVKFEYKIDKFVLFIELHLWLGRVL